MFKRPTTRDLFASFASGVNAPLLLFQIHTVFYSVFVLFSRTKKSRFFFKVYVLSTNSVHFDILCFSLNIFRNLVSQVSEYSLKNICKIELKVPC